MGIPKTVVRDITWLYKCGFSYADIHKAMPRIPENVIRTIVHDL